MRIEIRDDMVLIDGYVNAVERDSKVLCDSKGTFIEKIKAGAFQRALERAKKTAYDVKVLLNHDYSRELTSTKDSTTTITEDNIGLRCQCEIRDADVVEKAKNGKLSGWSFGFICLKEDRVDGDIQHRDVRELELREVSILDDTKMPAYNGTSIEVRDDMYVEERSFDDEEVEIIDNTSKEPEVIVDNHEYFNRYMAVRAGM